MRKSDAPDQADPEQIPFEIAFDARDFYSFIFGPLRGIGTPDAEYFAVYPNLKLLQLAGVDDAPRVVARDEDLCREDVRTHRLPGIPEPRVAVSFSGA